MAKITTAIILDTRKPLADGTYRVRLRVTFQRRQEYYLTGFSMSKEDFRLVHNSAEQDKLNRKERERYRHYLSQFQGFEAKARGIIDKIPHFTFETFEKKFLDNETRPNSPANDVFSAFDLAVERFSGEGRVNSASSYECAGFSLLSFVLKVPTSSNRGLTRAATKARKENLLKRRRPLPFAAVTVEFLEEYEKWMLSCGNSLTTVGIYLRPLRALFGAAREAGEIPQDLYPFGKRRYQIPAGRNVKKAIRLGDIKKIFTYEPAHDGEAFRRDLWVFSYLCNGINPKDIARLRYRNLEMGTIHFIRAKTERTSRRNLKAVVAARTPDVNRIIERWGTSPKHPDAFVFPILEAGLTPKQERDRISQAIKDINKCMKRIAAAVGIESHVTTYTARHSYATVMKLSGAPMGLVSDSLGHSSMKTTDNYLASFEAETLQQYAANLTAFGN